jgi:hypothetical protein
MFYLIKYNLDHWSQKDGWSRGNHEAWVEADSPEDGQKKMRSLISGGYSFVYDHQCGDGRPFPFNADLILMKTAFVP